MRGIQDPVLLMLCVDHSRGAFLPQNEEERSSVFSVIKKGIQSGNEK